MLRYSTPSSSSSSSSNSSALQLTALLLVAACISSVTSVAVASEDNQNDDIDTMCALQTQSVMSSPAGSKKEAKSKVIAEVTGMASHADTNMGKVTTDVRKGKDAAEDNAAQTTAASQGKDALNVPKASSQAGRILSDVPRIIHQSWKTVNLPQDFQRWSKTWKDCLPGWEYKLHTDKDNRDIFVNDFPELLETYDNYPAPIFRADAARLAYMAKYGGLYVDLDIECLKDDPFSMLSSSDSIVLACEGVPCHQLSNAFMMGGESAKGFFKSLLMELPKAAHQPVLLATGPLFVTQIVTPFLNDTYQPQHGSMKQLTYRPDPSDANRVAVKVLDDALVFGIGYSEIGLKEAALNRSWVKEHFPNSISLSHWAGSWLPVGNPLKTPLRH